MRLLPALLAALALAAPALAEDPSPLTAEEFDALTRGQVMDTWSGGTVYGVEKFLPGGKSIWEDERGCMYGTWKQVGELICFTYEDDPANPDCWTYFDAGDGVLVLHDPRFNANLTAVCSRDHIKVVPRPGLMLIFPNYVEGLQMFGAEILPGLRSAFA